VSGWTIWKTVLKATDIQTIEIPPDARILCAREQHEQICIWYWCNPDHPKMPRTIAICGTGHPAPPSHEGGGRYLGSAFLQGGQFVFHVFERA
jgi:hypothetical protein